MVADTGFALSFILDDFYACTGFYSNLASAVLSNFWLISAAWYDTSKFKNILAVSNFLRTFTFLLFNDFGCEYAPNLSTTKVGTYRPQLLILVILIYVAAIVVNIAAAYVYFKIDDFLSN